MANVTLWGASYTDVPAVTLPQTGGGTVTFYDSEPTTVTPLSVTQNGTYTAPTGTAYSPVTVNVSGGGEVERKDVNFYDYDGTLLHSYSAAEASALTELPSNPSHTGLTAQGWNYTLAHMKAEVTAQGQCDIGQMYVTDDGKTRIYLDMQKGRLNPYLYLNPNGTVTIDWGDGSPTDTLTGKSLSTAKYVQHIYPSAGSYIMTLTATSGTFAITGSINNESFLRHPPEANSRTVYLNAVQKVELGNNVELRGYAFASCSSMTTITIPSGITSIPNYAFDNCRCLSSITIPNGVTDIGGSTFSSCFSLASVSIPITATVSGTYQSCNNLHRIVLPSGVTALSSQAFRYMDGGIFSLRIPSGVTEIGGYTFNRCQSLKSITIPDSVTSIGDDAFDTCMNLTTITIPANVTTIGSKTFIGCYGLSEIHFKPTTPPTVSNINTWNNVPSDCKIYVPSGKLSAYTGATNFPSSSTYTYVEESA